MRKILFLFLISILFSCKTSKIVSENFPTSSFDKEYFDQTRNRKIPVTFYVPQVDNQRPFPVVIFSHGYGFNNPSSNKEYEYLLKSLAKKGYFVTSIQHELPTDDLLPLEGKPQIVRRSNWERGAENINFVLEKLKKDHPYLNFKKLVVSGHSNGGDMSVLFAEQHPEKVWKLITLDQRRYAFPRVSKPKIYSLRSSDQPADEGVLPTLEEQKKLGMTIIKLPNTIHNHMDSDGTPEQKKEIVDYFLKFLEN